MPQFKEQKKYISKDCHSSSISVLLSLLQLELRFFIFSSLNLLKQTTGEYSRTALEEFSQFLISGTLLNLTPRASNLLNFISSWGNIIEMRFSSSQTTKSMIVTQPQYQPASGHSLSYQRRIGSTLLFQISIISLFSSGMYEGLQVQIRARMAVLRSCLFLRVSILILSGRLRPSSSGLPAFYITQCVTAVGPVTAKFPSMQKGMSLIIHPLASLSLNLLHSSGLRNTSTYLTWRYSQSRRGSCALARKGQQPIRMGSLDSAVSRLQGRMGRSDIIILVFSARTSEINSVSNQSNCQQTQNIACN